MQKQNNRENLKIDAIATVCDLAACSFRWFIVAESTVRWFVVREKHCWMTADSAE
jgi:hypothetical protein